MSDAAPPIPTIEFFPVTGEPGAITLHAGSLRSTSNVLAGQGQRINAMRSALAPAWSGEAAASYQGLAGKMAGAFAAAASVIEDAAGSMVRYATELESTHTEAATAARESEHYHQQIVTWTGKFNDAQTALTHARQQLASAHRELASAPAHGPIGLSAEKAASAAITYWEGQLRQAQSDLDQARRQLADAHQQFTHWQQRGRQIRDAAMSAGEKLGGALGPITIGSPPLPGTPDYPVLEPTPGIGIPFPYPGLWPTGPVQLPAKQNKKGKGGKSGGKGGNGGKRGGKGQPPRRGPSRGRPHPPSGTGKAGRDRHTKPRGGNARQRPEYRKRPKGWQGPWPPKS